MKQPIRRLYQKYRNTSLRERLMIPVAAALLASLLACQGLLFTYTRNTLNRQNRLNAAASAVKVRDYADEHLRSIIELLYYIRLDDAIVTDLSEYLLEEQTQAASASRIAASLSVYKVTEPLISSLFLATPKGLLTGEGMPVDPRFQFSGSGLSLLMEESAASVVVGTVWRDPVFISHRTVIPILHRFTVDGYTGGECILIANIDLTKLHDHLQEVVPEDGSQILLLDREQNPITRAAGESLKDLLADKEKLARALEGEAFFDESLAGSRCQLGSVELKTTDWKLIYIQATDQIHGILVQIRNFFLTISALVTVLALLAVFQILRTITEPLTQLCHHIRTTDTDGYEEAFDYPYTDEFGTLTASYNRMIRHINRLLQEQQGYIHRLEEEKARADIEQAKKRRAELTALQAQINPHFLYNTLDAIHWKAEKAGAEDISRMTLALATLFRISLSRGAEIIPVSQELRHVQSYLLIQKERYRDRLSYTLDIAPDVPQLYTVKLLLQPLVENAIYHGIKESEHNGVVAIRCRRVGDILEMRVSDNGQGIERSRLEKLQADLARGYSVDRDGYGIFNVNARIRLNFGAEYGLTLESQWGRGTDSVLRLPIIEEKEVGRYVPDHDCG